MSMLLWAGEIMLKRSLSLIVIVLSVLCLSSCGAEKSYVRIEGERVPRGVYNYFYSQSVSDEESAEKEAEKMCRSYLAAAALMKKEGITLSTNYKRQAAEETEKLWSMFGGFYESAGVTKQDITKVKNYEMSLKELLHYYYGEGGKNEVSEEKLRAEFANDYVGFKAVEASFTKLNDIGESVEMAESEKKALRSTFNSMAKRVNGGADIDAVNESYNESIGLIVTQPLSLNIVKKNDSLYGEDFFARVSELSYGEGAVIESGSSIYMLVRVRIDTDDETFFMYKNEVLESLRMKHITKKIETLAESPGE